MTPEQMEERIKYLEDLCAESYSMISLIQDLRDSESPRHIQAMTHAMTNKEELEKEMNATMQKLRKVWEKNTGYNNKEAS